MAETRLLDRLTASDLFLLMWDDYGWSSDIGGLAVLDGASLLDHGGRVRIDAVRSQLEPRLNLVPRFRQLLYRPRMGLGWPLWVDAPTMDLADHIRVRSVAAPGGQAQLLAACQDLVARRLDSARPPWELWLLPGLPNQRVGAYLRLHHAVADGAAALAVFGALLDQAAGAPAPAAPPCTPAPMPAASRLLADNLRRRWAELGRGWSGLAHPGRTTRQARRALPAWREVLTERPAPHTSLNHPVGTGRRLAIIHAGLLPRACPDCSSCREMVTIARCTSPWRSSPRLASSRRRPPATTASTTSLTVAPWACAICLVTSRPLRMMARRRPVPTGWLRLVWGAGGSVRTSCHAGRARRA